jgi:hypothetical protein
MLDTLSLLFPTRFWRVLSRPTNTAFTEQYAHAFLQGYNQPPYRTRSNQVLSASSRRRPTVGDAHSIERGPPIPRRRKIPTWHCSNQAATHRNLSSSSTPIQGREVAYDRISFYIRSNLREVCKPRRYVWSRGQPHDFFVSSFMYLTPDLGHSCR